MLGLGQTLFERWVADSFLGDDTGEVAVRRAVERGVVYWDSLLQREMEVERRKEWERGSQRFREPDSQREDRR